ncbi:MAG: helix-turn-helix transcriptional regulator [Myxococcaceae bacterium]|nr:helix-turn-helix transcriptional regulator [Myxococcaceae bacterium]
MKPDLQSRGVLDETAARGVYDARRVLPADDLAEHVAYFWLVRWRLDAPYEQHAITLPAAHFVFEQNDATGARASRFAGPGRRRFTRRLEGAGHILGIALHAGTAFGWLRQPLARFVDRLVPLRTVWKRDVAEAERTILGARSDEAAVRAAERLVRRWKPEPDADSRLAARLVERTSHDRSLCRVEQLVALSGRSERGLQRLFHRHVGVSPKAVIRRFRLVEAADALDRKKVKSLTELAHQLGYYDQAHFVRDFKATVGRVPSALRR